MSLAASQTGPDLANGRNGDDFADALDALDGTRRRSLRKREEKSYAESPDLIIEEDSNNPGGRLVGTGVLGPGAKTPHPSALASKDPYPGTIINNGDIEMESENEEDEISAPVTDIPLPKDYSCEELTEKRALIKRLQTRLRNDEMSLVILKKIRHSQVLAEQAAVASAAKATAAAAAAASATLAASNASVSVIKNGSSLAKGGHPSHKMSNSIRSSMANITPVPSKMPDLSQLTPVNVDPKNLPPSLPANLVNLMSSGALGAKVTPMSSGRGSLDVSKQSHKMPVDTETPAQKQAAAKMALRKQLEKTLLQIPPPKPPPPEMHFIPNPTNSEFICLLGLEECVGKILHENKENTSQPMPFSCSQCSTDFTPTWKWDKGSRGSKDVKVICENCVTTNVKKALKAEHTNRLKAAFVKALQQEQELEAHMAATGSVSASPSPNPVTISPAHRVASPDTRDRGPPRSTAGHGVGSGLDVTIRSTPNSSSRSAPSAHQSRPISSVNSHHQSSSSGAHRSSNHSRSAYSTSNMSSSRHRNHASSSGSSSVKATTSSSSSSQAAAAAQAAASLMGGYDLASLAAIQQMQQQMLLGLAGGTATSQASAVGSGRGGGMSSSSNSSSNNAAAALSNQLAAMNQLMANPLLYNYQALAMAQAMQAAAGSGGGSSGGASKGSSSSGGGSGSNSATNQMLEIQRQAAEQIQRQYLLDMIPPGSLAQSWGSKK